MRQKVSIEELVSRTKEDLVIEAWEKLDCDSVGADEIKAIEALLEARFGPAAVVSPMRLARILADEGAELRHAEIMELYVERRAETLYDAALRNLIDISSLEKASASIPRMTSLYKKFAAEEDREGLRLLREKAIRSKEDAHERSLSSKADQQTRLIFAEIAEWLTIWLRTPDLFDNWLKLRVRSAEFNEWFGDKHENA